jgi:hypothetical protein
VDHGGSGVVTKLTAGIVLLAGISFAPMGSASGSCSAPVLLVDDPHKLSGKLRTGSTVVVAGSSFVDGCEDSENPMRNVGLVLRQGARDWDLGVQDAGSAEEHALGRIAWRVRVPEGVRPGRAILVAGSAELPVSLEPARVRRASSGRTKDR